MYTPRQSSSSFASEQAALDLNTGIRVVIQPSQSSYFAGEPFSCTITFTNTRSPVSNQTRVTSASFIPGHKRAAHSVSSAPLARPPTSPGPPKTAQQFPVSQRDIDSQKCVQRRGLIGKRTVMVNPAVEKKRRTSARSLSVDITPQDLINRLAEPGSPTVVGHTHDERSTPRSPLVSPSLKREHVVPPSHPHARKHSVVSDDLLASPSSSTLSQVPFTPTSGVPFQLSLDPITENSNNVPVPAIPTVSTAFTSSSELIQPPSPPHPQGNRPGHAKSRSFGLGLPLPQPTPRTKSVGNGVQPPHSAFSATFPQPATELLLYAYAQLTGSFMIDSEVVATSADVVELCTALSKRTAIGGGSLDIGTGQPPQSSSNGRFFNFLSTQTPVDPSSQSPGLLSSFFRGSASRPSKLTDDADDALPTLETQPSLLAVDLSLAPGESRSYSYVFVLPPHLPPTFKGRVLRFSYQLVVGACRATTPFAIPSASPSSSRFFPSTSSPALGSFAEGERRQSRIMRVPIRVYNHVAVGHGPIPYDLMWPVARRRAPAATGRVEEVRNDKDIAKQLKPAGSRAGVWAYAQRLLSGEDEFELESAIGEANEGGSLSGCAEAVEINTRNPKKVSYDVSKGGENVAVLTFVKSAYRLGETVLGVVELNEAHCRAKVLKLSAMLEAHESLPWTDTPVRRVHAEHHSSLVSDMRRVAFTLDIPSDASPAFKFLHDPGGSAGGLEWKVRMCLLVAIARGGSVASAKGKGRATEVRRLVRDGHKVEWGSSWRAPESIAPVERLRATAPESLPRKTYGSWPTLFSALVGGTFHDAGSDSDEDDSEEWTELQTETVECMVPLRVYPGNTAFHAIEVAFEV